MANLTIGGQTDFRDGLAFYASLLAGDDEIRLGRFSDYAFGFGGNDLIFASGGNDTVFGDQGRDTIFGGFGNDRISGGVGADRLTGGAGKDRLSGGEDLQTDVFVFLSATDSGVGSVRDTIVEFVAGIDEIDLSRIDANPDRAGDQAFVFSGSGARAFSVWVVDTGADLVLRADVTGDRTADLEIAVAATARIGTGDLIL